MHFLLLWLFSASAQLYVGGSLKAWRDGTDHVTTAAILPEIGYTYSDQWAFGTVIGWDHTHETGITTNLFKIEPYARLTYFKSGIVGLFVDGGFGLGFGKQRSSYYLEHRFPAGRFTCSKRTLQLRGSLRFPWLQGC